MTAYRLGESAPDIKSAAFVAKEATIIGRVAVGAGASVWPGAVLRGDNEPITVGARSNVQEGAVLHADPGYPLLLGEGVTVGHQVMLHGCTVGDGSLIGIQSVVLNGAVIGNGCLVGAGSVITERKVFPDRVLILGVPATAVRGLTDEEVTRLAKTAEGYVARAEDYARRLVEVPSAKRSEA